MSDRSPSHGRSELLGERQRLVEQCDRGRRARKLVPGDAEPEDDLGAVDVGEDRALGERPRGIEQVDRRADVPLLQSRPGLARAGANVELDRVRRLDCAAHVLVGLDGLLVLVRVRQRLGAREQGLDPAALVRRDAAGKECRIDVEALRQPLHRLGGRAGLPPLDLADVLLREAVSGELGLRQACGDAKKAEAVAQPRTRRSGSRSDAMGGGDLGHGGVGTSVDGVKREVERTAYPFAGIFRLWSGSSRAVK